LMYYYLLNIPLFIESVSKSSNEMNNVSNLSA
jgi:hypothetical protein